MKIFKKQIYNLFKISTKLLQKYVLFSVCRKELRGQDDAGFAAHPRSRFTLLILPLLAPASRLALHLKL